jgi:hypothetical protein
MPDATGAAIDYGDTDSEVGFDVTDEVDVGDLSDQEGNDTIDKASRVRFEIRKASVRPYMKKDETVWRKKFLALDLVVGPLGVDGEGKYANKHFFQDLLLVANVGSGGYEELNTEHYKTKARFPVKQFFKAMGYDPAAPPRINDEWLESLLTREVVADIQKKEIQSSPAEAGGKWVGTGEYKNEVANFRSAE